MNKISAVALLLVSLSMPATAAPRGDDSPRQVGPIQRIVRVVKHLFATVLDDSWDVTVPKP